jgi:type IV secretion system protein VirB4
MHFTLPKLPAVKLQEKEVGISKHLPFAYLDEHDIVRTKNGDYLVVLKITGIAWDTLEDHELNFEQTLRAKLFGMLADPRFAIYHTIIRSKISTALNLKQNIAVAAQIHSDYQKNLQTHPLFSNDLYITILLKGSGSKGNRVTSRVSQWLTQLSHGLSQKQAHLAHQAAIKTLNEVTLRFITSLDKYKISKLAVHKTATGIFSEQLQFFARILNWQDQPLLAIKADVSRYLPKRRLFFGAKGIESVGNLENDARFATMLSLKEYPNSTYPGMLDYLLQLPIEMVVTQSFAFQHRQQSREDLELQLRRLRQSGDPDEKGENQLRQALGGVVSGEFGFGYHHLTTMVLADDLQSLEENVAAVSKRFAECGIVAIRERLNLEASFWAQFPGNFRYIVRKLPITTDNFAALCSLNNDPIGQKTANHWGEAVTLLKTPSNLPFFFNFHKAHSDVGHTLILGTTGSGKTLLSCFLLSAALKYNTRIFYFDKDHGAEAFMRSLGASYSILGSGVTAGLNPLQLPDSHRNRRFLVEWLSSLLSAFGDVLSGEDIEIIQQAVKMNYENLQPLQRTLENLAAAFGAGGPGTLRNRIDQWHSDRHLSEFFGAAIDSLRLDNRSFCFEMGYLLEKSNAIALPSVLLYLFHRIQMVLDESPEHTPTIICLDEAWALLGNAILGDHIKNWLKTFRKRNAIVLLLSQELADITKSSISESINAETATKIFFPDSTPIKEVYRDTFQLSEREMNLLKAYSSEKNRFFLIKQPHASTFATLDMAGMEHWIPLLSGNSDTIKLLHKLMQQHGTEPEKWLPYYLKQAPMVKSR